jgi:acetylornithine deacetylase/succinyl-diaminopimelate desuccinylase-like protein
MRLVFLPFFFAALLAAQPRSLDWAQIDKETLEHFSALVRINSTDPGGSEKPVVDYLKSVLDREGIEAKIFTRTNLADPSIIRPNLVARVKGSGKKRPLLIVGHTDTVNIDPAKWKHGPLLRPPRRRLHLWARNY